LEKLRKLEKSREQDDHTLLQQFRQQDRAAFDTLYAKYAKRLFRFALQLTNNICDAEDLVQETFLSAYKQPTGFRYGNWFLPYLLGICTRRHRDTNRKIRVPIATSPLDENTPNLSTTGATALDNAAILRLDFAHALQSLDAPLREAFLVVVGQELTMIEAAIVLKTPVGTVKWRVAEAKKRLRILLSEGREA
jgi:RNA polymerase sigma-70 factor, ECF subfamily